MDMDSPCSISSDCSINKPSFNGFTLPDGFEFYDLQIAGHVIESHCSLDPHRFNVLYLQEERLLLKPIQAPPRGNREVEFYQRVWSEEEPQGSPNLKSLRSFVPRFYGLYSVELYENFRPRFMKLENLTEGMQRPCALDIKVGRRTFDPTADAVKIQRDSSKYPLMEKLGFRVLGMKYFDKRAGTYVVRDRKYGLKLSENDIHSAFHGFFQSGNPDYAEIVRALLQKLEDLIAWFSTNRRYCFFSSSVLFVYDAAINGKAVADAKMIDFAHVFPTEVLDENVLYGLRNLHQYLHRYFLSISSENEATLVTNNHTTDECTDNLLIVRN